jgi:outer membrane lipoprotein carrier protein
MPLTKLAVGIARCAVPVRAMAGGMRKAATRALFHSLRRAAALTAQRAVPTMMFALGVFSAFQNVRAADTNAVLDSWFAAQKHLHTWSADFVQTRTLKALTQPLVATGHVSFAVPNDFRWELGQPAQTIALRHGDEMFVIYPRLKRAEHYPLGAGTPAEWRDTMSLLQAGFPRDRKEFEAQFQILSLVETNGVWQFSLQPKSVFARRMMPELRISLATNDFSLAGTELVFVDGSRMRNDFTNAVLNPPLDEKLFEWTPPADFKVTNPFSQ